MLTVGGAAIVIHSPRFCGTRRTDTGQPKDGGDLRSEEWCGVAFSGVAFSGGVCRCVEQFRAGRRSKRDCRSKIV